MQTLNAFFMAVGMFSIFPAPKNNWDEDRAPLVIPLFPLVGALIGSAWFGITHLFLFVNMKPPVQAALGGLVPFVLSGCLHLDGWMDTADAVFSRRSLAERRRILKDPSVGAFAVVALAFLFVTHFAAYYTLLVESARLAGLVLLCVVSRAATGIFLLRSPSISETGYMATFQRGAKTAHSLWLVAVLALSCAVAFLIDIKVFLSCVAALLAALLARKFLLSRMGGLSGDLCGCVLTACEVCGLLCLAAV